MSKIISHPCDHLGRPTGKTVLCGTCKGRVELRTFSCVVHGECTQGKRVGDTACCVGCPDDSRKVSPPAVAAVTTPTRLIPERTIKIDMPHVERADGHGDHYNCSIIRWRGKTLMASRLGWVGSSIWLCELGDDWQVVPGTLRDLGIQHPNAFRGVEDPRLFEFNGGLCLTFSGYDQDMQHTSLFWAVLTDDLRVESTHAPKYGKRRAWEKNWSAFEHNGKLHFVYSVSPHVVLRVDGDQATEVARTTHDFAIPGHQLRGGAASVRIGGEWYSWFHTFGVTNGVTTWGLGLYTFAATPPFQLTRKVQEIILTADPVEQPKNILYPCGAILRDGTWAISYGSQDRECWAAEFDARKVERALQ